MPLSDNLSIPYSAPDLRALSTGTNVLHAFRSYTYNITLSCVEESKVTEKVLYSELSKIKSKIVVASSSGKASTGFDYVGTDDVKSLVEGFNAQSPGRFNFYFNDIDISTMAGFNKRTGISQANIITFSVFEPYSLGGFFEALSVAAKSAGYVNYAQAIFLLTLEFKGYYGDPTPTKITEASAIEPATRYFPIILNGVKAKTTDQGTRYECTASPANEFAFGDANKLLGSIAVSGTTLKSALTNFAQQLTDMSKASARRTVSNESDTPKYDQYKIVIPKVGDNGELFFDQDSDNLDLLNATLGNLVTDNISTPMTTPQHRQSISKPTYTVRSRQVTASGNVTVEAPESGTTINFSNGANIHDCIAAIVRDSSFVKEIYSKWDTRVKNDFVEYFNIGVSITRSKDNWDNVRLRPTSEYTYYVVPYKMHVSRLPGAQGGPFSPDPFQDKIRRRYNYLYTGKNLDVLRFEINYDLLFYQSLPPNLGNTPSAVDGQNSSVNSTEPSGVGSAKKVEASEARQLLVAPPMKQVDPAMAEIQASGEQTRPMQSSDPYSVLAKALHKSILDNVGSKSVELEILGDPFYLIQSGVGNIVTQNDPSVPGITTEGAAASQESDVYIELNVTNAVDYQTKNAQPGIMELQKNAFFSGIYRVNQIRHRLHDGVFKQQLSLIWIEGQAEAGQKTTTTTNPYSTYQINETMAGGLTGIENPPGV